MASFNHSNGPLQDSQYPSFIIVRSADCVHLSSYGEIGKSVIHSTLSLMFPHQALFHRVEIAPTDFLELVLIPETALILLQEDLDLQGQREVGIKQLRDSHIFGLSNHPLDYDREDVAHPALEKLKACLTATDSYVTGAVGNDHVSEVRFAIASFS